MVNLPQQRQHAVRPGSSKEANLLAWVEAAVLRINRRHAKKFSGMQTNRDPTRQREIEARRRGDAKEVAGDDSRRRRRRRKREREKKKGEKKEEEEEED